jgi:hypothetical protein
VSLQEKSLFAGGHIPNTNGTVGAARRQAFSVRRKSNAVYLIIVAFQYRQHSSAARIPQFDRLIVTTRSQDFAVRSEGYGVYGVLMPQILLWLFPGDGQLSYRDPDKPAKHERPTWASKVSTHGNIPRLLYSKSYAVPHSTADFVTAGESVPIWLRNLCVTAH